MENNLCYYVIMEKRVIQIFENILLVIVLFLLYSMQFD